jgi:SlyX protein
LSSSANTRLDDIESKLAFQEDTLHRLSEALVGQQARIDQLEAAVRNLAGRLQGDADDGAEMPDPLPPHY